MVGDAATGNEIPPWAGLGTHGALVVSGRAALALCFRHLGAGPILIPAYGCPALTPAVTAAGATAVYYPGHAPMRPLWPVLPDLARVHGARTVLVVHPLGLLQELDEVRRLQVQHGLTVIEDSSHSIGNAPGAAFWGASVTSGLAASLRKVVPVPCGGLAVAWGEAIAAACLVATALLRPPGRRRLPSTWAPEAPSVVALRSPVGCGDGGGPLPGVTGAA